MSLLSFHEINQNKACTHITSLGSKVYSKLANSLVLNPDPCKWLAQKPGAQQLFPEGPNLAILGGLSQQTSLRLPVTLPKAFYAVSFYESIKAQHCIKSLGTIGSTWVLKRGKEGKCAENGNFPDLPHLAELLTSFLSWRASTF
eukprot:1136348-Pelagomonas_calceolata.AAC.2